MVLLVCDKHRPNNAAIVTPQPNKWKLQNANASIDLTVKYFIQDPYPGPESLCICKMPCVQGFETFDVSITHSKACM